MSNYDSLTPDSSTDESTSSTNNSVTDITTPSDDTTSTSDNTDQQTEIVDPTDTPITDVVAPVSPVIVPTVDPSPIVDPTTVIVNNTDAVTDVSTNDDIAFDKLVSMTIEEINALKAGALSEAEALKAKFHALIDYISINEELKLAKVKMEDAVSWFVKHLNTL